MFTRDSKILSHRLTTPLTSVANAVGDVFKPTYNQFIKSLFANNEQGFAYDPNDLSTMFQDATGTVPVTAAGQPVGLMLDKSRGLVRGVEKWIDGSVVFAGASSRINPNTYRIYTPDGTFSAVQMLGTLTVGRMYEISFEIISIANAGGGIFFEGSPILWFNTVGKKRQIITATAANLTLKRSDALLTDYTVTNISVREIFGNHAYQTTSASRPILRQNAVTGANYLEFDGSDDFLQTSNIDFTSTDEMSLFTGIRKLSTVAGVVLELSSSLSVNNGSFYLAAPAGEANPGQILFANKGTVLSAAQNPNLPLPISVVVSCKGDIAVDGTIIRTNGTQFSSAADLGTGNYGNYPLYIGRRGGTSLPFNGHIYSLIGIGRLTTDVETAAIEKELAKRVGVTLNV